MPVAEGISDFAPVVRCLTSRFVAGARCFLQGDNSRGSSESRAGGLGHE